MAYLRHLFGLFRIEVLAIPWRVIALVFLIGMIFLPVFTQEVYILNLFTFCAIFAIFAASWDLLTGYTGQLSLGHALFFGLGAYTTALLNLHLGWPQWATIPLGAFVAVIAGLLTCLPALRLRGFYLALVTLALPIIMRGIVDATPDFTGGEAGLFGFVGLTGSAVGDYWLIYVIMLISLAIMWKLTDTTSKMVRTGLIIRAIREDEIAARSSGVNTTFYKAMAFAVSAFFAGIAGALYAHVIRVAGPSTIEVQTSFNAVIWTIFGGVGSIYGAVAGTYILYSLFDLMRLNPIGDQIRFLLLPVILALVLLFMPEGLIPWIREHIEEICPRCKIVNLRTRRYCRACRAPIHPDKEKKLLEKEKLAAS